ncbi:MAG: MmgE/PrpD family protein [Actinobacteria bacterium]|nr:MmgE/PrpD family protein [Actinomycetota bacterium]
MPGAPPQHPVAFRSLTAELAELVRTLRPAAIPAAVRDRARLLLLDELGAGLYGSTAAGATIVHEEARARCRAGSAAVWGRATRLHPTAAALVNATQAHAFELDDYHPGAKLHAGAVVVPAALATLTEGHGLDDLLAAIVVGYDVMIRIGLAMNASATRRRGWHLTGLTGPFGAAAAAGRLRGLDRDALVRAFGVAASCSAGIFAFSREGSMTKQLHAGRAAEAGLLAVELARRGLSAPSQALEADDGGLLAAVSDGAESEPIRADLGSRFELGRVAVKPYPCCGSVHSSIDCALAIRARHDLSAARIERVTVHTAALIDRQCGFPYEGAGGPLEAQMSMRYCVAAALADGEVGLRQFGDARRRDPDLRALVDRVRLVIDAEIDAAYPATWPGRVTVETDSGARHESSVPEPLGSPGRCTRQMVERKFLDLTDGILEPRRQAALIGLLDRGDGETGPAAIIDSAVAFGP